MNSAGDIEQVRAQALSSTSLGELTERSTMCRACPRLVAWREQVAHERRRSFADQEYWGRPIPGWGDPNPRLLILGLAPAAHGGNRTGRVFTGDRSGDWLFAALFRAGYATQPLSVDRFDGQQLVGARMVAAVRCAPPANAPTSAERDTCAPWLHRELDLVAEHLSVVLALGGFAWSAALTVLSRSGWQLPRGRRPAFGHGAEVNLQPTGTGDPGTGDPGACGPGAGALGFADAPSSARRPIVLLGSYHPSQQNTFTGRLTEPMQDAVLVRARELTG